MNPFFRRVSASGQVVLMRLQHILMTMAIVLMAGAHNPALAEHPDNTIPRVGVWSDKPEDYLPTPYCASVWDDLEGWFETIADYFVDTITMLGEDTIALLDGMVQLALTQDPGPLFDTIDQAFSDFGGVLADAYVNLYTPIGLLSAINDTVDIEGVSDYLAVGLEFTENQVRETSYKTATGFNPLKKADDVLNDLSEIGGDLQLLLTPDNLTNPISFANEYLQLHQKWAPAGSLTYLFTEKDPKTGLRRALKAFKRQLQIINRYSLLKGNPAKLAKVTGALLKKATANSKAFIDSIPDDDPAKKAEATVIAAQFTAAFVSAVKLEIGGPDFDIDEDLSRHPIYSAERRAIPVRRVGFEEAGPGYNHDDKYGLTFYHPMVENEPGCISLGDNVATYRRNYTKKCLKRKKNGKCKRWSRTKRYFDLEPIYKDRALCNVEEGRDKWWTRPVDYELVWGDNCTGGSDDLSVWKPVCPDGYLGAGFVAGGGSWLKPLPNRIACLKSDPDLVNVVDGVTAELKGLRNFGGEDYIYPITVYNRKFLGMDLMYTVPKLVSFKDIEFKRSLNVPFETAGIPPGGDKSHCVTFYTKKDFKGFSEEICSLDVATNVTGGFPNEWGHQNYQMLADDGISSFQCGERVAGVEIYDPAGIGDLNASVVVDCHHEGGSQIPNVSHAWLGDLDNFSSHRVKTRSSYEIPSLATLFSFLGVEKRIRFSPKTLADRVAFAQKAERARLKALADAAVVGSIPILRDACTYEAPDYNAPDDSACYDLGRYHLAGEYGLPQDWTEAVALLRLACDFSQPASQETYCKTYEDTVIRHCEFDEVPASCNEAGLRYLGYYNTSSDIENLTDEEKRSESLRFFSKGCYPDADFEEASLIGTGDGQACHRLAGVFYDSGWLGEAFNTYIKGCKLNYANSCDQVGTYASLYIDFILNGWEANERYQPFYDSDLALEHYNKSCLLGYNGGCNNAAYFNEKLEAVELFTEAQLSEDDINTPLDTEIETAADVSNSPAEGESNFVNHYFLELTHATIEDSTVFYETRDGSAIAGEDYIAASGSVTIEAGDTYAILAVEIIGDDIPEPTESFEMVISNPEGASFAGGVSEMVVMREILDDD